MTYESKFPLLDAAVPEVADAEPLLRRIQPEYVRGEGQAPSSAAFKTAELSVDREPMVAGGALRSSEAYPTHGLSRIPSAKVPRDLGLQVVRAPEPANMAHALVLGKKTDSVAKKLARCVVMLKPATAEVSASGSPVCPPDAQSGAIAEASPVHSSVMNADSVAPKDPRSVSDPVGPAEPAPTGTVVSAMPPYNGGPVSDS